MHNYSQYSPCDVIGTLVFQEPVENWPLCDCLISFHSKGFPLEKAIQYSQLRKPFIINNLQMQYALQVRLVAKGARGVAV